MKLDQIGLQLYTLRDHLKSPAQIAESLRKMRKIGYQTVETGNLPIADQELLKILAGEGIRLVSYCESGPAIRYKPQEVAEKARRLRADYVMCGFIPDFPWGNREQTELLARELDRAGALIREAGLKFIYHNHASEFVRVGDTTTLDYLYAHTSPQNVSAELDTYWVHYGGGDPAAWCRKMKGRLGVLHLKDYAFTPANTPTYAAIGAGNLEWKGILAAAEEAGCGWFVVEQDTTPGNPFDAIAQSYEYLRGLCG